MSKEITNPSDLFDENGVLIQDGWARKPILRYNRDKILAKWHRIKEWDNYVIMHPDYSFSVTVADVGYMGLITFEFINFNTAEEFTGGTTKFFTKGEWNLPMTAVFPDLTHMRNSWRSTKSSM